MSSNEGSAMGMEQSGETGLGDARAAQAEAELLDSQDRFEGGGRTFESMARKLIEETAGLIKDGDPRTVAYVEGLRDGIESANTNVSTLVMYGAGERQIIEQLDAALTRANQLLENTVSGREADLIIERVEAIERQKEEVREQLEALGITEEVAEELRDAAREVAEKIQEEVRALAEQVDADDSEPQTFADHLDELRQEEAGRSFLYDVEQLGDANNRLIGTASAAESIGARPSAVAEFVEGGILLADRLGYSAGEFGAWMIAVGFSLAGGEILTAEQTKASKAAAGS